MATTRTFTSSISGLQKGSVPPSLQQYIDPPVWADIVRKATLVQQSGQASACCWEWLICLFTGFCCIFCCHPAIVACMSSGDAARTELDLNYYYFGGAPVVQIVGDLLLIHVDNIPARVSRAYVMVAEPVVATAQASLPGEETKVEPRPQETPSVLAQPLQTCQIQLPTGGHRGEEIRFTPADGVERRIHLKEDIPAGGSVTVQYT